MGIGQRRDVGRSFFKVQRYAGASPGKIGMKKSRFLSAWSAAPIEVSEQVKQEERHG
jgi:hypothetical protein